MGSPDGHQSVVPRAVSGQTSGGATAVAHTVLGPCTPPARLWGSSQWVHIGDVTGTQRAQHTRVSRRGDAPLPISPTLSLPLLMSRQAEVVNGGSEVSVQVGVWRGEVFSCPRCGVPSYHCMGRANATRTDWSRPRLTCPDSCDTAGWGVILPAG